MSRSDRFQPIKDIADTRERDAGSIVAAAQQTLLEREQQLAQLKRYRDEYTAHNAASIGTLDSMKLQNYRAFLQRLADAIRQQEQSVEVARADYEQKRASWSERRVEAKALEQAIERFDTEARQVEANREQHQQDEQAATQRRSRELANETGTWKIDSSGRWKVDKK